MENVIQTNYGSCNWALLSKLYLNVLPNEDIWKHRLTHTCYRPSLAGGQHWWSDVPAHRSPVTVSSLGVTAEQQARGRTGSMIVSGKWGKDTRHNFQVRREEVWWWTKINSKWVQLNGFNFWDANKLNAWKLFTRIATIDIIAMMGYCFCSTSFPLK